MKLHSLVIAAGALILSIGAPQRIGGAADDAAVARRKATLDTLLRVLGPTAETFDGRINAVDKTWEAWQARTGELPPDFDAMPSLPELPDPLVPLGQPGAPRITTREQWQKQREAIRAGFEQWVFGKMPPPPGNVTATVVDARREGDVTVQDVQLRFGPGQRATLRLQMLVPPGKGPFPVFLTNHPRRRPWVNTAVRRGYIGCIVYAVDSYYSTLGLDDDSDTWIEIYPDADWSMIARWAWGAMRAVDYLTTRRDVIPNQIAISGHSRNSKSALLAAAFDDRIGAVVPSRGNNGDQIPWRFTSDVYVSESLQELTGGMPNWFIPRLRFFAGREHKLPVDQNLLISLVAPRGFLFSHAFTEHQGNVLGIEAAYRSVKSVYKFLGHEDRVGLYQQPGEHSSSPEDFEVYLDFFDSVFGRRKAPLPEMWVRNYTYERWLTLSGERIDPLADRKRTIGDFMVGTGGRGVITRDEWPAHRTSIVERIRWALGEEPPGVLFPSGNNLRERVMTGTGYLGDLLMRPSQGMRASNVGFGDDLEGELYPPEGLELPHWREARGTPETSPTKKYPAVIWLHPYSYATGYSRWALWEPLVRRGFVVMTFDQIGFGSRVTAARNFYDRYPHWSLLGKMVTDVRAAVDRLAHADVIDPSKIYLMGYGLGGKLAVVTAALDERVKGVVSVSGFAPLRLDTPQKGTEGVHHYSHIHGLLPRFGFFHGHEDRLPIDFDEILAAIAPRPVWIAAPTLDRFNPVEDVRRATDEARKVYALLANGNGSPDTSWPELHTPVDISALPRESMDQGSEWLRNLAGLPPLPPRTDRRR